MSESGYKNLISYQLSKTAFILGWDFVPRYYHRIEDSRQRDQIKQALRSFKQNIVEGSSERSLSRKLNLYDVAKASSMEALEDFEDILRFQRIPRWNKDDHRLKKLRQAFESYPDTSDPPVSSYPSFNAVSNLLGGSEEKEGIEAVVNYLIDVLVRAGYLLDRQIDAVEDRHERIGGYNENLLKKRLVYKRNY